MKKVIIIKSIQQLRKDMEVKFRHCCLSSYRKAIVTDLKYKTKYRFMDGKPIKCSAIESVNLTCENGKKITVTENNFNNFTILALM